MNEGAAASFCALNAIHELELEGKKVATIFITSQSISINEVFFFNFMAIAYGKEKLYRD